MRKSFLITLLVPFIYLSANAQQPAFEDITYKTKQSAHDSPTLLQKLFPPKQKSPSIPAERTIAAKVIVKGKVSLYEVDKYPDKCDLPYGTKPFYFIKTNEGTFPLLHNEQIGVYSVYQPYKNMLIYNLKDWQDGENEINLTEYNVQALSLLIESYNQATEHTSK